MTEKNIKDSELNAILSESKDAAPVPPDDLMLRVLDDAMTTQVGFSVKPVTDRRSGIRRELFRILGGWPAMAGLATATVAGVWLGAFPPDFLPELTVAYLGLDDADYLIDATAGFDLSEEAL